ncbi:MAG: hypothetical protein QGI94_11245 [Candidatus Scalindua sp.]|nr:hypothetical protein [Candidatus Scalindua sp.]
MIKTMQTHNANVKIKLNHLLWRSRSRDQDYQFITSPESPSIDGWFPVFNEVFSNCEPGRDPKNIIGKLVVPGDDHQSEFFQFIASYFIDDNYLDSSGRPIKQYLIWFHQGYDISEINKLLADNWGRDFISSSKEIYSSFYDSSDNSKLVQEKYIVVKRSSVDLQKLDFEDIGEIKYGFPAIDLISTQPLYNKIIVIIKKLFEKVVRS